MFLSGPLGPPASKTYLPAYPRLPRQFGSLLDQTAVEVLSALHPGLEIRKRIGESMVTAYFEQLGFSKPVRWAVACLMTPDLESRTTEHWQRYEPLISSNEIDRILFVTEHEVNSETRALMQSLQGVEHVTVSRLQTMLADSKPKRGSRKRVPAADGFVRVDHNNPAVDEAREKLSELANEIDTSNTLQLAREERDALLAEIMVLVGLLQAKVVRYAHIQTALGEQSVLKYLKGAFPREVRAGMLSVAIDRLFKALFGG